MAQNLNFDDLIPSQPDAVPSEPVTPPVALNQDIPPPPPAPLESPSNGPTEALGMSFNDLLPPSPTNAPPNPEYPTGPLMRGANAGWLELKGLLGDIVPMMATSDPQEKAKQYQEFKQKQDLIQKTYPAPYNSSMDAWEKDPSALGRLSGEWEQAKYNIAQGLVSNVPSVAAIALTAGLAGPEVVGADAAIGEATDAMLSTYAKRYATKVASSGIAGVAAAEPQMVAGSYIDRLQETGVDSPTTAVIAGTLANGLSMVPFMQVAAASIPKPLQQSVTNEVAKIVLQRLTLKQLPAQILGSAATGGIATAGQTMINQMANKLVADNYTLFSKENVDRIIDSAVSGAEGMAGMHALIAGPLALKGSVSKYAPEQDYTNSNVESNSTEVVNPKQALPSPEGSPEQPLPVRPSRKAFTDSEGKVDEEAYKTQRINYENYFKDRFQKSPEQYYKDRQAQQPEEPATTVKGETPEDSTKAVQDILNDFQPKGPDDKGGPPPPPAVASAVLKDGSGTRDVVVNHSDHVKEFSDFAVRGNYPPTKGGVEKAARDFVLSKQVESGNEHSVIIDSNTGKVLHINTDNKPGEIIATDVEAAALRNPNNRLDFHHNHPNDMPLSPDDLGNLGYLGHNLVTAHGISGESSAVLTPEFRSFLQGKSSASNEKSILSLTDSAGSAIIKQVQHLVDNDLISRENATKVYNTIIGEALHQNGIIEYSSSFDHGQSQSLIDFLQQQATSAVQETALEKGIPINERQRNNIPPRQSEPIRQAGEDTGLSETPQKFKTAELSDETQDTGAGKPSAEITSFNPEGVQRNIDNAEPHDNLKARNFAIPKALDRITQEITGIKDFNRFQTLGEDHSTVPPEEKANLLNMMRVGLDLVKGQAKRVFASDPTALTEFFHHAILPESQYITPSDRVLLENGLKVVRARLAERLGIDPRDLLTNYQDSDLQAQAFHEFMKNRYEGKPLESFGSASSVFNKLGNLLYRNGQVLNANRLTGIDSFAKGLTGEQLNDSLYAMAQKRNAEWEGRRVGATIDEGVNRQLTDPDFTDHAKNNNPQDIRHLTRADNILGTAMFIGTKYPWMSDAIQHFNGKLDRVAQISKQIGTIPRQILSKNKNIFNMVHDILDAGRMNNTSAKIEGAQGARVLRFKWHDGSERIIQDQHLIDQFEATRNNYKSTIEEDEGDFRRYLNKNYGLPEGSTPDEVAACAKRLSDQIALSGEKDPMYAHIKGQVSELNKLSDALKNIRMMKNVDYVPHLRHGKRAVMVFKKGEEGLEDQLVYLKGMEENAKGKLNPVQREEMLQEIEKYKEDPDHYILGADPSSQMRLTQNDILKKIPPQHVSMELIYSLFGDQSKESVDALKELIHGKINQSKLAFYLKPSSNIEGYSKDWPRSLETWVHARSLNQSNKESDAQLSKVLTYVEDLEKNGNYHPFDVKYLKEFVDYNRDRSADQMTLRTANFLMAMGGRMKTAIMQLFNGPQLMVPLLTQGGGNVLRLQGSWANNLRKAGQILSKSWGHSGRPLQLPEIWQEVERQKLLTPDQLSLAKTFSQSHLLDQTILDDNAGTSYESRDLPGKIKKEMQLTAQLLGAHIGEAEKMARLASILTTAKELSDPETFRRLSDAYESDPGWQAFKNDVTSRLKGAYTEKEALAFYLMEKAHGRYGKSGRGRIQRGMAASVFFPFSTQMLIQWELMKDLASKRGTAGKIASMYVLGSFLVLGGLSAMPGYATIKAAYNTYDTIKNQLSDVPSPAKDFDIDLRRWLGNAVGADWANIVQKGPARQLGLDISGTTTMPTSFETIASKPADVLNGILQGKSPDLTQMVGPALSPVNTAAQAVKAGSAAPLLPPVLRDIGAATKGMDPLNPQAGIKTRQGTQIQPMVDPKTGQPTYSTGDRVAKGMGFIPTQESEQRQAFYEEKWVDDANKSRAGNLVTKATEAQVNMLRAIKDGKPQSLVDAYRNQVNDLRKSWINFQKQAKTPNINADSFNNAVVKSALEQQQGWQPRTLKGRLQADEIKNRAIYGYQAKAETKQQGPTDSGSGVNFDDLIPAK